MAAVLNGQEPEPFRFKSLGLLAGLGYRSAVAEILGFRFSGFIAWWLWRTIYLMKLPGFERKLRVAIDWTLDLFFPRDIVYLKPLHTAHRPGAAFHELEPDAESGFSEPSTSEQAVERRHTRLLPAWREDYAALAPQVNPGPSVIDGSPRRSGMHPSGIRQGSLTMT